MARVSGGSDIVLQAGFTAVAVPAEANGIRAVSGGGQSGRVGTKLPARLVVEVTDEGSGFDLDACTIDPTRPERLESEEGRGLYLMRKLMDRVECVPSEPGNTVRLTLHRA